MLSMNLWIPFAVATLTFACMPGPAILYMTAQTLAYGRNAGLMAALGVHLGCYVHIVGATIGLASLMEHAPRVYMIIRFIGAAYLIWLGAAIFFEWSKKDQSTSPTSKTFRDSIVVEVLNPKTALFFLTFLPQFVQPTAEIPLWLQFLVLGMIVNLIFSTADVVVVAIASFALERLRHNKAGWLVPKACGTILVALGASLASYHI
ncbi:MULTISPECIES: LysE family translocator [Brucella]|jgi:threonine/homoserine/homoserine lactone efflux protein|uniref:LysE family translocator n=1 Tax=Brucella lupini TaxID=255457 RepID=A0AB34DIF8_9HYPH|nr:LysE family translocator [Brucella anthropi]KAB2703008.1 LysE family translocator [Brucella lupini]RNL47813.1 LysE family translocator [Ochrobactrum sp. MH181795]KAB2724439.1 LysE family translocator [Brucella anthropi]KAB2736491.1 LysE family translocator [Brucella anthropi]KAB2792132.1 LysE family translocator [Brucella anthropi]